MKKILAFCLLISLLIGLVGCGKKAHIVFPFAASDVTKIEVIYKDGESDAQKKTVNKETEIDSLYKSFSELSVQEKDCASADTLGSVVFTFYLADGTSYEINYLSFATKSGRLQSENAGFDYFTSGDLVGLWENLSGESKVVSPYNAVRYKRFQEITKQIFDCKASKRIFRLDAFCYFKQFSALYYFLFYEQEKVKCDWLNSSEHGVFINLFIFFRHIWKYGHLSP